MSTIFVISDTHFNHANILTFEDGLGKPCRTFSSVEEMNETMIERWNEVVKDSDTVYHLGDVLFGNDKEGYLARIMPRLRGKKRLIFGNHDDPKHFVGVGHFSKTMMWRMFPEFNCLLTHVPVHPSTLNEGRFDGRPMINIHGHTHTSESPEGPYKCVCVEQTDYRPVALEDLV